jgi:hypothetical protein
MSIRTRCSRYLRSGSSWEWLKAIVVKAAVEVTSGILLGYVLAIALRLVLDPIDTLATTYGPLGQSVYTAGVIGMAVYTLTFCTYVNADLGATEQ